MHINRIASIKLVVAFLSILLVTSCTNAAKEIEWKKFTYLGSGSYRAEIKLPKSAKTSIFTVDHDIPITKADLKPMQMKWVHKRNGKNYTFSHYTGLLYSSGFFGPGQKYAVYHKKTKEITWPVALQKAKKEILKHFDGRQLAERQAILNNRYQGIEVDFEVVEKKDKQLGRMKLFYVPKQKKRRVEYRIYTIMAIGDQEFLDSKNTKEVFNSLKFPG